MSGGHEKIFSGELLSFETVPGGSYLLLPEDAAVSDGDFTFSPLPFYSHQACLLYTSDVYKRQPQGPAELGADGVLAVGLDGDALGVPGGEEALIIDPFPDCDDFVAAFAEALDPDGLPLLFVVRRAFKQKAFFPGGIGKLYHGEEFRLVAGAELDAFQGNVVQAVFVGDRCV